MSGTATKTLAADGSTFSIGLASATGAIPLGRDHIVAECLFGVHEGVVHGFTHSDDAW